MNDPDILKLVKEQEDYLIKMRRYFHMNPELSNKELKHARRSSVNLKKWEWSTAWLPGRGW